MAALSDRDARGADDALRELRVAIEHHGHESTDIDDLRATLRRFCAQARRAHIPPERLVVAVKTALDGLPTSNAEPRALRELTRQQVVSLAISTYYMDGESADGDRGR